jgi:hypothetical protein
LIHVRFSSAKRAVSAGRAECPNDSPLSNKPLLQRMGYCVQPQAVD